MKKLYFLFLIVLLPSCMATKSTLLSYREYTAEKEFKSDKTKNDLFIAANAWLVESFSRANNVIQFSDKEAGIIMGRYLMNGSYSTLSDNNVYAIITLKVKDNLTKIKIAPQGEAKYYPPKPDDNIKFTPIVLTPEQVKNMVKSTIDDYSLYITNYTNW